MRNIPAELNHTAYCQTCYNQKIVPAIEAYTQMMDQAKNILVYEKSQGKETRLIRRIEKPVKIVNCPDRQEAMLRLAFFAAEANYNAIVDVDLVPQKVRTGSYQTTLWSGTGIPANVSSDRIVKDRSIWSNPN